MTPGRPRVHDLLRIRSPHLLMDAGDDGRPAWVDLEPTAPVWVVVRRTAAEDGVVAVGIRGASRGERWAATVKSREIAERIPPMSVPRGRGRDLPALAAHETITPAADRAWPGVWGPGGSVGYELVASSPVVKPTSDLDLVLYADTPLDRATTATALQKLRRQAGNVRIDLIIETPLGGVAADEWMSRCPAGVVLRTARGPVVADDPWRG